MVRGIDPWFGCVKKSPECAYCYAELWAERTGRDFAKVTRASDVTFYAPLKYKEPQILFTCSLSDFFIRQADKWRVDAWRVIRDTPHLYLILTKEPERILDHLPEGWPYKNVVLGVTVGLDRWKTRIDQLFRVPAWGYFVSAEPLLRPVDFADHLISNGRKISLVITGGESGGPAYRSLVERSCDCGHGWSQHKNNKRQCRLCGPDAIRERGDQYIEAVCDRYSDNGFVPKLQALEWVRSIQDQCQAAGTAFHHKQWGGPRPESGGAMLDGKLYHDKPWKYDAEKKEWRLAA